MRSEIRSSVNIAKGGQSDRRVISLITIGHFFSHLYIMALPPLFPILTGALGVGAAELGIALAVLNLATAALQAPTGFLVDRFGPARPLIAGHMLFAVAIGCIGIWPNYGALLVFMLLAGIGNSVYHPADYAILGARIDIRRLGRSFSIHTFGGHLGFAAAPVVMVVLTEFVGWRAAFGMVGAAGVLFGLVLFACRLEFQLPRRPPNQGNSNTDRAGLSMLFSPPVILALLLFLLIAVTLAGISSFTPIVLNKAVGLDLVDANVPLTVFLAASAVGVLVGGLFADKTTQHARTVAICCLIGAASVVAIVMLAKHSIFLATFFFAVGGLAGGALSPFRDLLVRRLAGPEHSGKVFGFVTTGFNLGGLIAPPAYGLMVDFGVPMAVFWLVVLFNLLTAGVVLLGERIRSPSHQNAG